jgi:hypothetical protein
VSDFVNARTNYKLFNRLQVRFRVNGGGISGFTILHGGSPQVGQTINPCQYTFNFDGQFGPANSGNVLSVQGNARIPQINDGSPESNAATAFNTLTGKDISTPVFWENIGSKITFSVGGGTSPQIVMQPYPTYYEYHNGRFFMEYPEALTPRDNFDSNPYPSGTAICSIVSPFDGIIRVTPGGRCGDQHSAPDPSARTPEYVQP